ncbi:MAG TPA: FG-GAP-like repeat-containing protein, partial [Ignavibacteriaceae bacterium]|nr:FG-GAP-like repeat-containing protein [Ignavibacteriaceae bacterium]
NAYLSTFTNDLNNNGKPELWIGGWGYINGVGSVMLYIYEADDNDQYSVVYTIALIGGISFFAGNMFPIDLDNDGKDEVLICIDQNVLALEYNNDNYELYYIKRNELLHQNSIYYSATVDDFDADGYPEIVISMDQIENNLFRIFCRILKKSNTVDIADAISSESSQYNLSDSYPNPFNPSTTLRFKIPIEDRVTIKVFNILGKEIKTLLDETRQSGEHLITWDGNDSDGNKMPSGIYFITMLAASELTGETRSFQKTIKAILLK